MFKLVESLTREPIRLPIKPGVRLVPGHVAMVSEHEGDLVIDLCKGNNALGLVGNRCWGGFKLDLTRKARVYPQRMVADVSRFDRENEILVGCSLYSNTSGELTSCAPFEGAVVLAKVISPASEQKKHMQILWL